MKKNLKDYRKEMERMQARSESMQKEVPVEAYNMDFQSEESYSSDIPQSKRWIAALLPALMAILMAIIVLAFLTLSEFLKKG